MEGKRSAASSTTPPSAKRQRQQPQHPSLQAAAGSTDDIDNDDAAAALEHSPEEEEEEDVENHSDERESEENDGSLLDEGSASPSASSLPSLPPAPPCTPTSTSSSLSNTIGTPLPRYRFDDTVSSSSFLEPSLLSTGSTLYDEFEEGAITPAPSKLAAAAAAAAETPAAYTTSSAAGGAASAAATASAPHHHPRHHPRPSATASLPEDFSEWAVGDRYQLVRMLGRGSYGEVAQAKDLYYQPNASTTATSSSSSSSRAGLHEFVAIKRIQSPFDQEVDAVRLFREMHILRRLRGHACIIQLIDVVQPPSDDLDDFHDLYLVFEYVDTDLYKLIMSPQYLTTEHIQTFLYQMLTGLKFIHSSSVIHRDLKPANILLNEDCSLKICDFGLARIVPPADTALSSSKPAAKQTTGDGSQPDAKAESNPNAPATPNTTASNSPSFGASPPKVGLTRQLTKHVVTRWYRAPELILLQPYTAAVDMWSLGCILAELLSMQEGSVPGYQDRSPLFPGGACYPLSSGEGYLNHPNSKNDGNNSVSSTTGGGVSNKEANNTRERLDQLSVIFGVIGPPSADDIASMGKANEYLLKTLGKRSINPLKPLLVQHQPVTPLEQLYPAADPLAMDLLKKMLQFNPQRRCTAAEALEHPFFQNVRKQELEVAADQALVGPDFLETNQAIDLATLKRRTYEEVLWWRDPNPNNSPTNELETNALTGMGNSAQRPSGEPPTSSSQHQPP